MKIEVLGRHSANGNPNLLGTHMFEFHSAGVTHYIEGEKRAEIAKENWPEYTLGNEAAMDAEMKRAPVEKARAAAKRAVKK